MVNQYAWVLRIGGGTQSVVRVGRELQYIGCFESRDTAQQCPLVTQLNYTQITSLSSTSNIRLDIMEGGGGHGAAWPALKVTTHH